VLILFDSSNEVIFTATISVTTGATDREELSLSTHGAYAYMRAEFTTIPQLRSKVDFLIAKTRNVNGKEEFKVKASLEYTSDLLEFYQIELDAPMSSTIQVNLVI
jgi:hypothetical protein